MNKNGISNIDDVLNQGNKKEILEFINERDVIKEDDLEKIYWMLKDKDFYNKLIAILKKNIYLMQIFGNIPQKMAILILYKNLF